MPPLRPFEDTTASQSVTKAIVETLAYFDVFDYPLTAVEVHKFLWRLSADSHCERSETARSNLDGTRVDQGLLRPPRPRGPRNDGCVLGTVFDALEKMENVRQIGGRFGYYFLPGREALVETRWQRYLIAEPKYKIALRVARLLRILPNVRLVAACNNLAFSNARKQSDVDIFIVTAPERIWLTRFLVTAVVHALGLRRHGDKIADRCCLSFYVTADRADLSPLALKPEDPYLGYWLATLAIISARVAAAQDFWQANAWARQVLPNFRPRVMNARRTIRTSQPGRTAQTRAGDWCNRIAKRLQLMKMARRERLRTAGIGVVITDEMLKFHEDDRRENYRQRWQERIEKFLPLAKGELEGVDTESIRGG